VRERERERETERERQRAIGQMKEKRGRGRDELPFRVHHHLPPIILTFDGRHAKGLLPCPEGCRILDDLCCNGRGLTRWSHLPPSHEQGLALLALHFLRNLLYYYQIELHHLSVDGILHIASFVMLCEAFLGIQPHFTLWKYFLHNRAGSKSLSMAGGVILQIENDWSWGIDASDHGSLELIL
jgi:hypothetical protein